MVLQRKSSARPLVKDRRGQILPQPWRFLLVTVLVISILFRFANLDRKPYWWDEVTNSVHSAGYSKRDFGEQIIALKDKNLTVEDLHRYQYPTSETTSLDVIRALADGEPQSTPVYYLLSRWWTQLFGSSVTVLRSLSAVISLLAFPSMYWLCLELFGSSIAAGIGVMLLAVSPFHLLFAQEVRMYGLWTVTILVVSASLLRAMRSQSQRDWGIYAASLTLGLYTFPFTILVAISHGIYVVSREASQFFQSREGNSQRLLRPKHKGFSRMSDTCGEPNRLCALTVGQAGIKISKTLLNYLAASIVSIIAYVPWIVPLTQIDDTKMATWRKIALPFSGLLKYWLIQTSLIFADLNPKYRGGGGGADSSLASFYDPVSFLPMVLIWVAIIYAFYVLICNSPQPIWSFILPLILVTALTLVVPDLISGGMRSTIARYLIPCYIGIQLAIVNLIYRKLYVSSIMPLSKKIWQLILTAFLLIGIISCALIINAPTWWIKSIHSQNIPIAEIINNTENPLILTPVASAIHLISISHHLNDQVTMRLVDQPDISDEGAIFGDRFLLNYPQKWLDSIETENKFKLEKIFQGKVVASPRSKFNFSLVRIL